MKKSHRKEHQSLKNFITFYQKDVLFAIWRSFVWRHLDYDNIIYDQTNNQSFSNKIEVFQYSAAFAMANAIK